MCDLNAIIYTFFQSKGILLSCFLLLIIHSINKQTEQKREREREKTNVSNTFKQFKSDDDDEI